jgi:putative transposase
VGGGLVRSLGGWAEVKILRRSKQKVLTDERILGTDDFVEEILREAEGRARHSFSTLIRSKGVQKLIEATCKKEGISLQEIQMGSRRGAIARVRSQVALKLVQELGIPLAEIARQLGGSTSAVCQILCSKQVNESTVSTAQNHISLTS